MLDQNYFSFFEIQVAFNIDLKALKKKYLIYTRKFHPDFFTQEDESKQAEVLALSSFNNEAYKVLSNSSTRINYILKLKEVLKEESKTILPPDFLMEVMDLNEQIMEYKLEGDLEGLQKLKNELIAMKASLVTQQINFMVAYDEDSESIYLTKIRDLTLKLRYLRRMEQNINEEEVEI